MMTVRMDDMVISALDLLMLFLVLLFLAVMAIRYDATKGLGERKYTKVYEFQPNPQDAVRDYASSHFQILVLDDDILKLSEYEGGQEKPIVAFGTLKALLDSQKLKKSIPCVIYEREKSTLFADLVRALVVRKIPIGLAQVAG